MTIKMLESEIGPLVILTAMITPATESRRIDASASSRQSAAHPV
jgi:hypothetical protein